MTLHLIELPLDLRDLHIWAGGRKQSQGFDEGQTLHHLLGEVFGPATLQPFRLMVAPRARTGTLYAYAALDADGLRRQAMASLTPVQSEVVALDRLRSLPRPAETWQSGQRIGFDLRLRPVVRLASPLAGHDDGDMVSFRKGAEVDAFLAQVLRGVEITREHAYLDWLAERLGPSVSLDHSTTWLARFQRNRIQRGGTTIEGPDAIVHGTLTITDSGGFADLLAKGIGRHRSYGYGMLLLRPPQRGR